MVILNNNEEPRKIDTKRYNEFLGKYKSGTEIIAGREINDLTFLNIPAKSALVIELKK
jgi:hypothetical protein